jgi:hypothetical protein
LLEERLSWLQEEKLSRIFPLLYNMDVHLQCHMRNFSKTWNSSVIYCYEWGLSLSRRIYNELANQNIL